MLLARLLRPVSVVLLLFILASMPEKCCAGGGPRNVLVVANSLSETSRRIAYYYQQARSIPGKNMLFIPCPLTETISADVCEEKVRKPIYECLAKSSLSDIDYIVVCKGFPLTADYRDPSGPYSITSILTCIGDPTLKETIDNPYGPRMLWSGLWGPGPETYWSSKKSFLPFKIYNVTRLDAFTLDDVFHMIDGASQPAQNGTFLLDKAAGMTGINGTANDRLGPGSDSAYSKLIAKGATVILDGTSAFQSNVSGLIGYFSWGSNDYFYTYDRYMSNRFLPGSIGDTYYSFSARTFTDPGITNRGSLIADLFRNGLCGGSGYVSEPYISTATFPNILFDRYIKGYNMAESFFASTNMLFWKSTVAGDPLMAPFATPPTVQLVGLDATLTGKSAKLEASASDASGIAKVEFYVDDTLVGTATSAPYRIFFDSTGFMVGDHSIEAIAYENSPVYTQGRVQSKAAILNDMSSLTKISQAFAYPDGQRVRLTSKEVTAAGGAVGDGFYIEDADRSAGIMVKSLDSVTEGSNVNVEGTMATIGGERVLTNPIVSLSTDLRSTGAHVKPVGMRSIAMGGCYNGKWMAGRGLQTNGLLVKIWGVVTSVGNGWFTIDDGSRRQSITGIRGVKIYIGTGTCPQLSSWIAVTGVCGSEAVGTDITPIMRTRRDSDIVVYKSQAPLPPVQGNPTLHPRMRPALPPIVLPPPPLS